jgi:hypothetical protein
MIRRTILFGLAGAFAAVLAAGPAAAEPVGFLGVVEGTVEVKPTGATSFTAAALDRDVSIGDSIRTGRASLAKLVLKDDSVITIDEETELVVDQYVLGSGAQEPSKVSLLSGHVRTKVGEAFGGSTRFQLHTPTAVIGVKGTEWLTWYLSQQETTYVCVVSGIVTVESNDPSVTGSYEPPVGSCAKALPHLRPEGSDLPTDLVAIDAANRVLEGEVPNVASGPGDTDSDFPPSDDTPLDPGDVPAIDPPDPQPDPQPQPEPQPIFDPEIDIGGVDDGGTGGGPD